MALWLSPSGVYRPPYAPMGPQRAEPCGAQLASGFGSGFWLRLGSALVGFRLASLRLSAGFCLGFRLDFGLLLGRFGFWLSCTRILPGFDLIWASAGFRLESALV